MSGLVQLRRPGDGPPLRASRDGAGVRVYVETYGCQMNVADTDMMLGLLHGAGYGRTDDPSSADVILINTCAVREKAEERVFSRAAVLARHKLRAPHVVLGITGCMAEHLKEKIQQRAPYVDLVVGPDGYRRVLDHLGSARQGTRVADVVLDRTETYEGLDPCGALSPGVVGRVTIQRGCDKFCTFCVVPYTRGRERGTPPREVLRQARALAASGCKEIHLLGQTVNSYRHEEASFSDLLRALHDIDGIERIRFTSPYPLDFSGQVIAAIALLPKVCKHVHLPLQTASDAVLSRMRRGYTFGEYRTLVSNLRAALPEVAITTDILVGFCDETEAEFTEILRAMEELRFDNAFMFAYSEREGTYAGRRMPDTVATAVKKHRLAQVIDLQRRITAEVLAEQVGRRELVLVEGLARRGDAWVGRTDAFRPVVLPAGPRVQAGALLPVIVESATVATLRCRVIA